MGRNEEGKFNFVVGAIVENTKTGKILLIKRSSSSDYEPNVWSVITGRIKQFEDPETALKREVKEETGLKINIVKPLRVFHIFRGDKNADNETIGIIYWCKTKSEKVKFSNEHSDFKWCNPKEALTFVKHKGVKQDIKAFLKERGQ